MIFSDKDNVFTFLHLVDGSLHGLQEHISFIYFLFPLVESTKLRVNE